MFKFLRFTVKTGIVTSAVYYTVDQGVWSDSQTTSQLYGRIHQFVSPYVSSTIKEIPIAVELPEIPKVENITNFIQNSWNRGVIVSCQFLGDLPETSWTLSQKYSKIAYDKIVELLNDEAQPSIEKLKESS